MTLIGAAVTSALMLGCGSSSHKVVTRAQLEALPAASAPIRCPKSQIRIHGHFHFELCSPPQRARIVFICAEAGYELLGVFDRALRDPQPTFLHHAFEQTAEEEIGALDRAARELAGSGENADRELTALAGHRTALAAFLAKVRRSKLPEAARSWYEAVAPRQGPCVSAS